MRGRSNSRERYHSKDARSGSEDNEEQKFVPMTLKEQISQATEKHLNDAIYFFTKAIELDVNSIESRYHLAIILQKTNHLADALKQLTKVIEIKKEDKAILLERGLLF